MQSVDCKCRPWMAVFEATMRRWRCREAQPDGGESAACLSTGTCEFGAAAVRRASQGSRTNTMFVRPRPSAHGLWLLSAETESSSLAAEASETLAKVLSSRQKQKMDPGFRRDDDQSAVRFAYAATSHFGPASAKFTWMRVCAPEPSALMTTPSPKLAWRTRCPSLTGKVSSRSSSRKREGRDSVSLPYWRRDSA